MPPPAAKTVEGVAAKSAVQDRPESGSSEDMEYASSDTDTLSMRSSSMAVTPQGGILGMRQNTMRGRFSKELYNLPCRARDTKNREETAVNEPYTAHGRNIDLTLLQREHNGYSKVATLEECRKQRKDFLPKTQSQAKPGVKILPCQRITEDEEYLKIPENNKETVQLRKFPEVVFNKCNWAYLKKGAGRLAAVIDKTLDTRNRTDTGICCEPSGYIRTTHAGAGAKLINETGKQYALAQHRTTSDRKVFLKNNVEAQRISIPNDMGTVADHPRYDKELDMLMPPLAKRVTHNDLLSELATRIPDNSWKREDPKTAAEAARPFSGRLGTDVPYPGFMDLASKDTYKVPPGVPTSYTPDPMMDGYIGYLGPALQSQVNCLECILSDMPSVDAPLHRYMIPTIVTNYTTLSSEGAAMAMEFTVAPTEIWKMTARFATITVQAAGACRRICRARDALTQVNLELLDVYEPLFGPIELLWQAVMSNAQRAYIDMRNVIRESMESLADLAQDANTSLKIRGNLAKYLMRILMIDPTMTMDEAEACEETKVPEKDVALSDMAILSLGLDAEQWERIFSRVFAMIVTLGMCTETVINFDGVQRHGEQYTFGETIIAFQDAKIALGKILAEVRDEVRTGGRDKKRLIGTYPESKFNFPTERKPYKIQIPLSWTLRNKNAPKTEAEWDAFQPGEAERQANILDSHLFKSTFEYGYRKRFAKRRPEMDPMVGTPKLKSCATQQEIDMELDGREGISDTEVVKIIKQLRFAYAGSKSNHEARNAMYKLKSAFSYVEDKPIAMYENANEKETKTWNSKDVSRIQKTLAEEKRAGNKSKAMIEVLGRAGGFLAEPHKFLYTEWIVPLIKRCYLLENEKLDDKTAASLAALPEGPFSASSPERMTEEQMLAFVAGNAWQDRGGIGGMVPDEKELLGHLLSERTEVSEKIRKEQEETTNLWLLHQEKAEQETVLLRREDENMAVEDEYATCGEVSPVPSRKGSQASQSSASTAESEKLAALQKKVAEMEREKQILKERLRGHNDPMGDETTADWDTYAKEDIASQAKRAMEALSPDAEMESGETADTPEELPLSEEVMAEMKFQTLMQLEDEKFTTERVEELAHGSIALKDVEKLTMLNLAVDQEINPEQKTPAGRIPEQAQAQVPFALLQVKPDMKAEKDREMSSGSEEQPHVHPPFQEPNTFFGGNEMFTATRIYMTMAHESNRTREEMVNTVCLNGRAYGIASTHSAMPQMRELEAESALFWDNTIKLDKFENFSRDPNSDCQMQKAHVKRHNELKDEVFGVMHILKDMKLTLVPVDRHKFDSRQRVMLLSEEEAEGFESTAALLRKVEGKLRKYTPHSYDPKWKREAQRRIQRYMTHHMTFLHKIAEVAELRNIDTFDLEWRKYEMIPPPEGAPEGTEAKKPEEFMHMYVRVTAAGKEMADTRGHEDVQTRRPYYVPTDLGLPQSELRRRETDRVETARVQSAYVIELIGRDTSVEPVKTIRQYYYPIFLMQEQASGSSEVVNFLIGDFYSKLVKCEKFEGDKVLELPAGARQVVTRYQRYANDAADYLEDPRVPASTRPDLVDLAKMTARKRDLLLGWQQYAADIAFTQTMQCPQCEAQAAGSVMNHKRQCPYLKDNADYGYLMCNKAAKSARRLFPLVGVESTNVFKRKLEIFNKAYQKSYLEEVVRDIGGSEEVARQLIDSMVWMANGSEQDPHLTAAKVEAMSRAMNETNLYPPFIKCPKCRETGHTQGACPRNESPAGSGKKRQRDSTADTNSDDWPHPRKSRSGVRTQSHGESSDDEPVPQQNFAKSIATMSGLHQRYDYGQRRRQGRGNFGTSRGRTPSLNRQGMPHEIGPCYNCKEYGHVKINCPKLGRGGRGGGAGGGRGFQNFSSNMPGPSGYRGRGGVQASSSYGASTRGGRQHGGPHKHSKHSDRDPYSTDSEAFRASCTKNGLPVTISSEYGASESQSDESATHSSLQSQPLESPIYDALPWARSTINRLQGHTSRARENKHAAWTPRVQTSLARRVRLAYEQMISLQTQNEYKANPIAPHKVVDDNFEVVPQYHERFNKILENYGSVPYEVIERRAQLDCFGEFDHPYWISPEEIRLKEIPQKYWACRKVKLGDEREQLYTQSRYNQLDPMRWYEILYEAEKQDNPDLNKLDGGYVPYQWRVYALTLPESNELHVRAMITEEVERKAFGIEETNLTAAAIVRGKQYREKLATLTREYKELEEQEKRENTKCTPAKPTKLVIDVESTVAVSPQAFSPYTAELKLAKIAKSIITRDLGMTDEELNMAALAVPFIRQKDVRFEYEGIQYLKKHAEAIGITPQLESIEAQKRKYIQARKDALGYLENQGKPGVCYRCLWAGHYGTDRGCCVQEGIEQQQLAPSGYKSELFNWCQHCGNGKHAMNECYYRSVGCTACGASTHMAFLCPKKYARAAVKLIKRCVVVCDHYYQGETVDPEVLKHKTYAGRMLSVTCEDDWDFI